MNEVVQILQMKQQELADSIVETYKPTMYSRGQYIIYKYNNKPKPMLCVHLDTINTLGKEPTINPITDFEYDSTLDILGLSSTSKLRCLGGDDRAGVWIALKVLKWMQDNNDYKYDIGFFYDEEVGCIGSSAYQLAFTDDNITCYIGLDRKSSNGLAEVATYGFDNEKLINKFISMGYTEHMGSVTDASNLSGEVACVNLSVGYEYEHTKKEILHISCMYQTYVDVIGMDWRDEVYEVEELGYMSGYYNDMTDDFYIYELEQENTILRDLLESMGVSADDALKECRPAYMESA